MTPTIVAPDPAGVEPTELLDRRVPPPSDLTPGVPAGVDGGPRDVERILGELTADVDRLRVLIAAAPAPGFLVTAADVQRLAEVDTLLAAVARILAERNPTR